MKYIAKNMNDSTVKIIENKIGYAFKNKALLVRAFTHSSASSEADKNYESLEFLGDSILDFVVAKRLLIENPNAHEGALTQRRAEIVSKEPLENAIRALDVAKYLIVGKGESVEHITEHTKVMSNLFESIVGAIYLDSAKIEETEKFVLFALKGHFNGDAKHNFEKDFKSELNEFASKYRVKVEYTLVEQDGKPHDPTFTVDVLIDGVTAGRGKGKSKKIAEQEAAKIALRHIDLN